jgi:hypothetical protein
MSKLIKGLKEEQMRKILNEGAENEYVKTSVTLHKDQIVFLDALAEYFDTSRSEVVKTEMQYAIESALIATEKQELIAILKIAAKKSSQWKVALEQVKKRTDVVEGEE